MTIYIFTGRFQPIHNGHVHFVESFIEAHPRDRFMLAVIRDCLQPELVSSFDVVGNVHFQEERNPYSASQVLEMVSAVFQNRLPGKVLTTLLPRPSSHIWQIIDSLFVAEERVWIFPARQGDEQRKWEDAKANFYQSRGERILYVPSDGLASSTEIRQLLDRKDYRQLSDMVPPEILPLLQEYDSHTLNTKAPN